METCAICCNTVTRNRKNLTCCPQHTYHAKCIAKCIQTFGKCPHCRKQCIQSINYDIKGTMRLKHEYTDLAGFPGENMVIVTYDVYTENHHTTREAYFPYKNYMKHLSLLCAIFEYGHVFTVDVSITTNKESICWNDLHHRTSQGKGAHGYPIQNPTYFDEWQQQATSYLYDADAELKKWLPCIQNLPYRTLVVTPCEKPLTDDFSDDSLDDSSDDDLSDDDSSDDNSKTYARAKSPCDSTNALPYIVRNSQYIVTIPAFGECNTAEPFTITLNSKTDYQTLNALWFMYPDAVLHFNGYTTKWNYDLTSCTRRSITAADFRKSLPEYHEEVAKCYAKGTY